MNVEKTRNLDFLPWRVIRNTSASILALGILTGCSSVPDALNPAEWYRDTVDLISGDDESSESANVEQTNASVPGADEEFPSLSTVPERPSVDSGQEVAEGLIADPNKPEYAAAPTRQSEDDGMASPPEPATIADGSLQPAPPAQPVAAVTAESVGIMSTETATVSQTTSATTPTSTSSSTSAITLSQPSEVTQPSAPLVVEPGRLPSGETYEEYRSRLMAGLGSQGSVPIMAPVTINTTAPASGAFSPDTVVISSSGIDMTTAYTSSNVGSTTVIGDGGFQQLGVQDGQSLLSPGSTKVATIHFNSGSSRLDVNDLRVLQKVVALQKQNGGVIRVIGHASSRTRSMDPVRHKMVNYNVSVARADSVAKQLVRLGTNKTDIFVGAVSDTQPKYYEVMPSGEAGNRRAEIYIDS